MRQVLLVGTIIGATWGGVAFAQDPPAVKGAHSSAPLPTIANAQCGSTAQCLRTGGFTPTFVEPVIYSRAAQGAGQGSGPVLNPLEEAQVDTNCTYSNGVPVACKPAGASLANLPDGRVLFFNALEGTENVEFSILIEGGGDIINDQTRVLTMNQSTKMATWTLPGPVDGGAMDVPDCLLPGCLLNTGGQAPRADQGALFCADLKNLYDGRVIAVGGTEYYSEPGVTLSTTQGPFPLGVIELQGLRSSRIYNPATNSWAQTGNMNYGRWYPALTTLPDGNLVVVSGVTKLAKPVYPDNLLASGRNVVQTETFSLHTGTWTDNGGTAQRSLPLFPRMHLLPNGQVFYDAAGQAFSPFGQSYDQPLWNVVSVYDPNSRTWTDLGYAGLPLQLNAIGAGQLVSALNPTNPLIAQAALSVVDGLIGQTLQDPAGLLTQLLGVLGLGGGNLSDRINTAIGAGMRGSTFSLMMPLVPNAAGAYTKAQFLTAGGVLTGAVLTNPGTYLATTLARLETVDVSGTAPLYSSQSVGSLNQPRWYGTPALLPTGQVMLFSGADRDEVVLPGSGNPILRTEMYDPATQTWTLMATQNHARTYHNTALLQQDGSVLVGGHAPINTAYLFNITIPGAGLSPTFRDPSFETYYPPYMFRPRPTLSNVPAKLAPGETFTISTPQAGGISSAVLVRRTALTHDVDADQRTVQLTIARQSNGTMQLQIPANQAVVPPGNYMLFINQGTATGLVPSVSAPILISGATL